MILRKKSDLKNRFLHILNEPFNVVEGYYNGHYQSVILQFILLFGRQPYVLHI